MATNTTQHNTPYTTMLLTITKFIAVLLVVVLAMVLFSGWSVAHGAQDGIFYTNSTQTFHARLTKPKVTINKGNKLFNSYRYDSSHNTVIPLKNTTPYIITTDRSTRNLKKVAKGWGVLNSTFNIYNGSLHFNYGEKLLNNNKQNYVEVHNLGLNGVLVKVHLKKDSDYFLYKHDKENHTVQVLFHTDDAVAIQTAPHYNTGIIENITWQTKQLPPNLTGILTLKYHQSAPVGITNGRYWLNIGIGRFTDADIIPPTYRSNLTVATIPTPQELNLHQYLPVSKTTSGTGIEHVSLLPSGVLQIKLDGATQYTLKRVGALKYRLEMSNITFIDTSINILRMSDNASIASVTPIRGVGEESTRLILLINTHRRIQLKAVQSGSSLFVFDSDTPSPIKNMANVISILDKNIEVTENGIRLTYTMSSPISIDSYMVGRQLFVRFSNRMDLVDSILNPQLYLNNYIDLTAFGTLYGHSTLTVMFRRDANVRVSGRDRELIIDVKGL